MIYDNTNYKCTRFFYKNLFIRNQNWIFKNLKKFSVLTQSEKIEYKKFLFIFHAHKDFWFVSGNLTYSKNFLFFTEFA